jgi:4-hydroxy-tetrahydrodipicolinate reductase
MDAPIRLLIHGASGRMGQALLGLCAEAPERFGVVGAVSRKPQQRVVDGVPQFGAAELNGVPAFDVAIDFSLPEAFDAVLATCVARKAGFVSGTTGLSEAQRIALEEAGRVVPALWASNFSLGVAVLADAVARASRALPGWDCDIVEAHHAGKRDAPSGTALSLGEAAAEGGMSPRYASLRAGDIVGEHTVQFSGMGERLEFIHRATSRDVFARGALHAAQWLAGRVPGQYRMADLLG